MDVHVRGGGLQPGADAEPGGRNWWREGMRSSVPKRYASGGAGAKSAQKSLKSATHLSVGGSFMTFQI
jgi:hypothetical protein